MNSPLREPKTKKSTLCLLLDGQLTSRDGYPDHPGSFVITWVDFSPIIDITFIIQYVNKYHSQTVKSATDGVYEKMNNFIPYSTILMITYTCWCQSYIMLVTVINKRMFIYSLVQAGWGPLNNICVGLLVDRIVWKVHIGVVLYWPTVFFVLQKVKRIIPLKDFPCIQCCYLDILLLVKAFVWSLLIIFLSSFL